jgi:hypothetical protein
LEVPEGAGGFNPLKESKPAGPLGPGLAVLPELEGGKTVLLEMTFSISILG